jgi:hypothetical protein
MEKLILLLAVLPKDTLRSLDKFIQSPYFVTHADTRALYQQLRERPGQAPKARTRAEQKRLYHCSNYLTEALETFFAVEQCKRNPHAMHLRTIEAYRSLRLHEAANAMYRYTLRRMEADTERGADYHRTAFLLHQEAIQLTGQQNRAKNVNVQDVSNALDVSFIIEKLRIGCLQQSHASVSTQSYEHGLLDLVLQFLQNHPFLQIPVVAAYYHGYYAQQGLAGSDTHFRHLKHILQQHGAAFSAAEVHDLYLMAVNFCIRRINLAEQAYLREIFDLYRSGLEQGALLEAGALSRWTYNNITATALRLQEFEWVRQFLFDYAPLLPAAHREGAQQYNLARYYYEIKQYSEAMLCLQRMEYDDVLVNLVAKILLAKIYFEQEMTDALESHLDSIQIYIRRQKVLGYHKDNYTAIIRFMRKLLAAPPRQRNARQALRAEIEAMPRLTEKEWFLKQLNV